MIDAGAAGIHMEDQRAGTKKCGHMGGKVLVACREHVARLTAVRLQADIMGCELNIVARTDALSAKLIDNNVDPVDHPFIIGAIDANDSKKEGTFVESGIEAIKRKFSGSEQARKLEEWNAKAYDCGLEDGHKLANSLGFDFYFDWEKTRTYEGFYPIKGSVKLCVARQKEFARVADLCWMETPTPTVKTAKEFADGIKKYHPDVFLAYNLSPSFNWDAAGMTDKEIGDFCTEIGKLGYVWQFITLAGFHANALVTDKFAKDFKKRHMISYVQKIQRKEGKHGVDQLLHQKWSGAELIDQQQMLVSKNSAINSTNEASTEHQFANIGKPKL
jgi:isocitrate lyase